SLAERTTRLLTELEERDLRVGRLEEYLPGRTRPAAPGPSAATLSPATATPGPSAATPSPSGA
ncbi:hypothetical protein ACWDUG_33030, partial [Streptomyces cellulosae]